MFVPSPKEAKSNISNGSLGIIEVLIILLQTFKYNLHFTFKKTKKMALM
jgi:hypothetical protein